MAKRITINTIAERAGVSRGTVDRVLNGRPHVKPEIAERVLRTMRELGYAPPRAEQADALGLSRSAAELPPCRLGVLLTSESGYLRQELLRGVQDAQDFLRDFNVEFLVQKCETELPEEAVERLEVLAGQGVNGIAVCAKDHAAIVHKINELREKGVVFVTMNTDLTGCDRLCFIGQDLIRSGRVAGELMAKYLRPEDSLLIAIGNPEFNAHRLRLQGFCERLYERGFAGRHIQIIETYNDYTLSYQKVRDALGTQFCRRCNYCAPCTVGISIPSVFLFQGYLNRYGLQQWGRERYATLQTKAGACIRCGACEPRCPYNLPIRQMMQKAAEDFGE